MVSGGRGLGDKSAAGGGSAERWDTTGIRKRRGSGDETRVRVPGVDALEDAQASKVRELELQAVERLVARRVAARDAALNLELLLDVQLGLFFPLPRGAIGEYPRRPEHVVEPRVVRELIGDAVADTPARRYVRHLALRGVAMASAHRSPAPNLAAKTQINVGSRFAGVRHRETLRSRDSVTRLS